jgi:hypothetical protein
MEATLAVRNDLRRAATLSDFAIGGAVAVLFYAEPVLTYDLAVFVLLPSEEASSLVDLSPLYERLWARGYSPEREAFLPGSQRGSLRLAPDEGALLGASDRHHASNRASQGSRATGVGPRSSGSGSGDPWRDSRSPRVDGTLEAVHEGARRCLNERRRSQSPSSRPSEGGGTCCVACRSRRRWRSSCVSRRRPARSSRIAGARAAHRGRSTRVTAGRG